MNHSTTENSWDNTSFVFRHPKCDTLERRRIFFFFVSLLIRSLIPMVHQYSVEIEPNARVWYHMHCQWSFRLDFRSNLIHFVRDNLDQNYFPQLKDWSLVSRVGYHQHRLPEQRRHVFEEVPKKREVSISCICRSDPMNRTDWRGVRER